MKNALLTFYYNICLMHRFPNKFYNHLVENSFEIHIFLFSNWFRSHKKAKFHEYNFKGVFFMSWSNFLANCDVGICLAKTTKLFLAIYSLICAINSRLVGEFFQWVSSDDLIWSWQNCLLNLNYYWEFLQNDKINTTLHILPSK